MMQRSYYHNGNSLLAKLSFFRKILKSKKRKVALTLFCSRVQDLRL